MNTNNVPRAEWVSQWLATPPSKCIEVLRALRTDRKIAAHEILEKFSARLAAAESEKGAR